MRITFLLFILILFCSGCDKIKRTKKKFLGEWTIVSLTTRDANGLTAEYEVEGKVNLTERQGEEFYFDESYTLSVNGVNYQSVQKSGLGSFRDSEYFELQLESPSNELLDFCRIILLTKDDMKLEIRDLQYTYIYILQKP